MLQRFSAARCATDAGCLPELSEIEIIRHFTRLSTWNYAIDLGMYPLGSCTMKYNPRVNEFVSRIEGIAEAHPYQPESLSQGALQVMQAAARVPDRNHRHGRHHACSPPPERMASSPASCWSAPITSRRAMPAGRSSSLIPRTAPIPRPLRICGYEVENLKSNSLGGIRRRRSWNSMVDEDTAALMLTNPSTIGVFESEIHKVADILHAKGALLYMDGANMNALVGKTRPGDFGVDVMHLNLHKTFSTPHGGGGPGSGPVACKKILEPFLPTPVVGDCAGWKPAFQLRPRRSPWVACACSTATTECLFARSRTFSPMAPMACDRPPKTPC